jgi:hypothetical protein
MSDWQEHTKGCGTGVGLGCVSFLIAATLAWFSLTKFPATQKTPPVLWWCLFIAAVLFFLLTLSFARYYRRAVVMARKDAEVATSEARVRYTDIPTQVQQMETAIRTADFHLDVATREFAQHRYAPFWDAMESAAKAIGDCHTCQGWLAFDIDQYVNALSGRIHDFPTWDTAIASIPEVAPALSRFTDLKNAAEADYHFASMREFRETRQVMIAGFKTLGEALRHLENAMVNSIQDLKRAVDRSVVLRAADTMHLQVVARFLIGGNQGKTASR